MSTKQTFKRVPPNQEWFRQTKPKKVRFANFRGGSPELAPEPPLRVNAIQNPLKGVSGTNSGLFPGKLVNLTYFGLVCRNYS